MAKETSINKVILTSEYLAPVSSIWFYYHGTQIMIESKENYQKKSTRNLSVPLQKGKTGTLITEVEISYESNWPEKHLQAIKTAYGNSPYYEHYIDELAAIIDSKPKLLFDLNRQLTDYLLQKMNIEVDIGQTQEFQSSYPADIVDLRRSKINQESLLSLL